jgi:glycine/D-amino acid oxidase-like deaminating enzyme
MKRYRLNTRTIRLDDAWDVIVAGGGPAGCAAAVAAAREGARTLLIERVSALGGMGTLGLVPAWCPFSDGKQIIYRGLAEKVFTASKAGMRHIPPTKLDWVDIDPERLKRIYDDLVGEAGVRVLFDSAVTAVDLASPREVRALIVANKAGLSAYRARVYVDCTGDADVCAWAGAGYDKGNAQGDLQPATHCFVLSHVDSYQYANGGRPTAGKLGQLISQGGKYPRIKDPHLCNNLIGPGTVGFNSGHLWDVDNTDPDSVSRALPEGRRLAEEFRQALAEYAPQTFANAFLVATGALLGIRETRRVKGVYTLTIEDYLQRRTFADEICRNAYPVDVHCSKKETKSFAKGKGAAMDRYEWYKPGESHGIPYRCLVPKALKNVLVAGRSISTDRDVQGSTRTMPVCLCVGEAAGVAAAMAAADRSSDVHRVNTDDLRRTLIRHGAYLP